MDWHHGEDYELQARRQGYTLGDKDGTFEPFYEAAHRDFINGFMTYTQYIKALKKIEKGLNKYAKRREGNPTQRSDRDSGAHEGDGTALSETGRRG